MKSKLIKCKTCGADVAKSAKKCPQCGAKQKKPLFKKWWFWLVIAFLVIGSLGSSEESSNPLVNEQPSVMQEIREEDNSTTAGNMVVETEQTEDAVSTEYKNALKKAESYSDFMHMSKAAIYEQLTSEYGEKFSEDAAQYAMDNLQADYKYNALKKAESYSETMYMSKASIYDQLISEYGEQFTEEEAQYAIDNLIADYKANALEKAKSYQKLMNMSKNAVYDQLVSEYGEKFTAEEAQYAIDNLE